MSLDASTFTDEWNDWNQKRIQWVTSTHGPATLIATNWLTEEAVPQPKAPGEWRTVAGRAVGTGLSQFRIGPTAAQLEQKDEWTIGQGDFLTDGALGFGLFVREDDVALRVFDPATRTRAKLRSLAAFPPDPTWSVTGSYAPATEDAGIEVSTVDGRVRDSTYDGTVDLVLPDGHAVTLTVTQSGPGLRAVFGDTTNGTETYRFRFLDLPAPASDGSVVVDFNRAYLPPCAFSDEFVCPFPSPGNRWPAPVLSGERALVLEDGSESIMGLTRQSRSD